MEQHDIHNYLEDFFRTSECPILENDGKTLHVQLTVEMDKKLMNRPFYWKYVDNVGMTGEPLTVKLVTDPAAAENSDGEFIHFGSPRLHQIFETAKQMGAYLRQYEAVKEIKNRSIALEPWLGMNMKISYQCDRKKDLLVSYGLQLINGEMVDRFQEKLQALDLTPKIPDYCFTISPLIKPQSGIKRVEHLIESSVESEEHDWADQARQRWEDDLALLDQFYVRGDDEDSREIYEREKAALREQYEPMVKIEIVSGGLFYLTKEVFTAA
ncbi:MAG TPA: YqhG family protein [Bacillales bacterium]|nr:YqhG family protein [Bacillales bacterium]